MENLSPIVVLTMMAMIFGVIIIAISIVLPTIPLLKYRCGSSMEPVLYKKRSLNIPTIDTNLYLYDKCYKVVSVTYDIQFDAYEILLLEYTL